ncbi:hypothetical protein [Paracoccus indicus]|nr:hypothetical protein [Paracoccus indicus]
MALDTTVVQVESEVDASQLAFSADDCATTEFPRIQSVVQERTIDVITLA